jgi:hypothetical protein
MFKRHFLAAYIALSCAIAFVASTLPAAAMGWDL